MSNKRIHIKEESNEQRTRTLGSDDKQIDHDQMTEEDYIKENSKLRKEIQKLKEENSQLYRKIREVGDKMNYP